MIVPLYEDEIGSIPNGISCNHTFSEELLRISTALFNYGKIHKVVYHLNSQSSFCRQL